MIDTQKHLVLTYLEQVAASFEFGGGVDPDKADEIAVKFFLETIEKTIEEGKHIFTDEEFEQLGNLLPKALALNSMIEDRVAAHFEANKAAVREALEEEK